LGKTLRSRQVIAAKKYDFPDAGPPSIDMNTGGISKIERGTERWQLGHASP
jgi:hypothetical protein